MTGRITVIGLGSGDESQLTLGAWSLLQSGVPVWMRTADHPVAGWLKEQGVSFRSYDDVYERHGSFEEVYEAIAADLTGKAAAGESLVYAVPGHPMVAEYTVMLLRQRCPAQGIELRVLGGESFLDQCFLRLGFDPVEGFQLLDAARMTSAVLQPRIHTVVTQIYDTHTASDAKLTLMEVYPDDTIVIVAHQLGFEGERIVSVPLFELDRVQGFGNHSLVWIPRTEDPKVLNRTFEQLRDIVHILRSPGGCPWDREQTHQSIRKHLIEETYEVVETIDEDDPEAMCEELGDLLLQIMLHAEMEEETGTFTVRDVIEAISEKLIRRHPHVFGEQEAETSDEVLRNWQAIKNEEKRGKGIDVEELSLLDGAPKSLPGLMKAWEYQKRAAKVGFDWTEPEPVFDKIREELVELEEAWKRDGAASERVADELGDLLFAVVNVSRFLKTDPDSALSRTNRKFYERFRYIESKRKQSGAEWGELSLAQMEEWWQEAKSVEKNF